jgi:hypothetical protein
MSEPTYLIIRFKQHGKNIVQYRGFTLDEAKSHCQNEKTSGPGWFDGFTQEQEGSSLEVGDEY